MIIKNNETRLEFKPREKKEVDDHHVAFYDLMVGDEKLGVTEVVISHGRRVNTILETEDGNRFEKTDLVAALEHAGHTVVQ